MILIDFEGYKINKKFIIKEFCLINLVSSEISNFFVKSPILEYNNQSIWVYKNIHHIGLNYGNTSIKEILNLINKHKIIFVKGHEKSIILKSIFKELNFINIELLGCPKYKELTSINCSYESHNSLNFKHCALKKALFFRNWLLENEKS
jgi:hypothetical protein